MSSLQISLIVAGALLLLGVVLHSAWSAFKNRPKRPSQLPVASAPDATVATSQTSTETGQSPPSDQERQEPQFDATNEASAGFGAASVMALNTFTSVAKKPSLDALIDVIAQVLIESVVSGDAALAAMPATRRVGSKAFGVEGLNSLNGLWELPLPGQRYSALQCGVQLANRMGALNQIEYSEFVIKTQAFADAVGGEPEFPEMQDEVARARELDQFASAHDAQLSFTLRAKNTAWSLGYVQQSAARLGFIAGSIPGRMVLPSSQAGAPLLGLVFDTQAALADNPEQTAMREITLSLDVPQVPRAEQPFLRMCEAASALAQSMEGVVIDDNGNPINPQAMDQIGSELEQLYDMLDQRELSAGSVLGRRLFS
jgi:hypothetical protein